MDPIAFSLGPIAVHWYGIMYVVAIGIALWVLLKYTARQGIHEDQVWGVFIWTVIAGLVGGRLYFVIQQPNLVQNYLLDPQNILAVWNGGMAFYGAIFAGTLTLFLIAPKFGIDRFLAIDCGALFAAIGQIFGRFGNIINGDILGAKASNGIVSIPGQVCSHAPCIAYVPDSHIQPVWAVVYLNPHSFATPGIAYQPAPVYEILLNLVVLAILWPLRYRLPQIRAGYFFALYLALYSLSQFLVFFARSTEPTTPVLGIDILKQAQWTALAGMLLAALIALAVHRYSKPWTTDSRDQRGFEPGASVSSVPHIPGLSTGEARRRLLQEAETKSQRVAVSGAHASVQAAPAEELSPWEPKRPEAGGLRNVFGAENASQEPEERTSLPTGK
ncbi:MAG: prolipoprotein diacylglyceryl transferase [Chloroflexi bacterium]|nr:MAG: prolipoprotein diacylglyceryl transferase [Chloroflexota bacterium]